VAHKSRTDPSKNLTPTEALTLRELIEQASNAQPAITEYVRVLHEVKGYTMEAIAAPIGVAPISLTHRLWRARKRSQVGKPG